MIRTGVKQRAIRLGGTVAGRLLRVSITWLAATATFCAWVPGAYAQAPAATQARAAVIDGLVTDTSLVPLADATVTVLGSGLRVVTGPNGRFRITELAAGRRVVLVRRLGFEAVTATVTLTGGETQPVSFMLQKVATRLDTVSIKAQQPGWRMTEFEQRRKFGEGQFITQAEIEKRNVVDVSDLLATLNGIHVSPGGRIDPMRATGLLNHPCALQVFLDGVKMPASLTINDMAVPHELAGIELYLGPATIPVQYKVTSGGGFCGVILLWTRVGS